MKNPGGLKREILRSAQNDKNSLLIAHRYKFTLFAVGRGFLFCSTRQTVGVGVNVKTLVPGEAHQGQVEFLGQV